MICGSEMCSAETLFHFALHFSVVPLSVFKVDATLAKYLLYANASRQSFIGRWKLDFKSAAYELRCLGNVALPSQVVSLYAA